MASMLLSKNQRLVDHQSSPSLHVTCVTWWPNINISIKYRFLGVPSKHETFVYNLYNVGLTSTTLVQHCTNVIHMFCVYGVCTLMGFVKYWPPLSFCSLRSDNIIEQYDKSWQPWTEWPTWDPDRSTPIKDVALLHSANVCTKLCLHVELTSTDTNPTRSQLIELVVIFAFCCWRRGSFSSILQKSWYKKITKSDV